MFKIFQFLVSNPKACGNITNIPGKIPRLSSEVFTLIEIAVPVVLVIMGTIDLFKGITASKEDEMIKGRKMFVKRLVTGSLIFFIMAITKFLISLVDGDNSTNIMACVDCFVNNKCKTGTAIKAEEEYRNKVDEHNKNYKQWSCTLNGYSFDVTNTGEGFAANLTNEIKVNEVSNSANWKPADAGDCPAADKYVANVYKNNYGNKVFDLMTKDQSTDTKISWDCTLDSYKIEYNINGIILVETKDSTKHYEQYTSDYKPTMIYQCPSSKEYKVVTGGLSTPGSNYFKVTKK